MCLAGQRRTSLRSNLLTHTEGGSLLTVLLQFIHAIAVFQEVIGRHIDCIQICRSAYSHELRSTGLYRPQLDVLEYESPARDEFYTVNDERNKTFFYFCRLFTFKKSVLLSSAAGRNPSVSDSV